MINLLPCDIYLRYIEFCDTTFITYELELPPNSKKIGFNLLDDDGFIIPYILNKFKNSHSNHQLPTQAKNNLWINDINGE